MNRVASKLPEYDTVMNMYGVGKAVGPQLMAEIGDQDVFTAEKQLLLILAMTARKRFRSENYQIKSDDKERFRSSQTNIVHHYAGASAN